MKILLVFLLSISVVNAEFNLRFLINFNVCPGCSDIALLDISNKLEEKFPHISKDALVVADDIRELKPIIKKFKNLIFYRDSTDMISEVYKISELPSLILTNENNEIILSFNNILKNKIDYDRIDSVINSGVFTPLNENEDYFIMNSNSGSVNKDGSKLCIFDYLNFRVSIFDTDYGKLVKDIAINDTIPLVFKANFTEYEWNNFYSEDPNIGVKIQNCFFNENDKVILTGFCVGDVKLDTLHELNKNNGIDTIANFQGIAKHFYIIVDENNSLTDSLSSTSYTPLKTKYYKSNTLISNLFPSDQHLGDQDSIYMIKYMNLSDKTEIPDINLSELENNNVNFRKPIEQILQAHSTYNFDDEKLIFLNSYNNIFFIKEYDLIREIEPKGILIDVFKRDQLFDSQSFIDSSRVQNFNKYFTHSITFDNKNNFYVILYYYEKGKTRNIAVQKYSIQNGFIKEVVIDLDKFDDEFSKIAPINFKSPKILTKWKTGRWKIMDLSKIID
ncbi:MAG: hypothetical protein ACOCWM_04400 [Cyclobacteriaceae bacterium]